MLRSSLLLRPVASDVSDVPNLCGSDGHGVQLLDPLTQVIRDLDALWITTSDGKAHLVSNKLIAEQWSAGEEWADGVFPARCGVWVTSGSLCEPIGEPCPPCVPPWATGARRLLGAPAMERCGPQAPWST